MVAKIHVEIITVADHAVTKAVACYREFEWHELAIGKESLFRVHNLAHNLRADKPCAAEGDPSD